MSKELKEGVKNNVSPNTELSIKKQKLFFKKEESNEILELESTITEMKIPRGTLQILANRRMHQ